MALDSVAAVGGKQGPFGFDRDLDAVVGSCLHRPRGTAGTSCPLVAMTRSSGLGSAQIPGSARRIAPEHDRGGERGVVAREQGDGRRARAVSVWTIARATRAAPRIHDQRSRISTPDCPARVALTVVDGLTQGELDRLVGFCMPGAFRILASTAAMPC